MPEENTNTDYCRPFPVDGLLNQYVQQSRQEKEFQKNEVLRLQAELNRLKNIRDRNINHTTTHNRI